MITTRYLRQKKKKYYYWMPDDSGVKAGFPSSLSLGKDYVQAVQEAESWNNSLDHYRRTGEVFYPGDLNKVADSKVEGTIAFCISQYRKSRSYLDLKPITQKGYDQTLNRIEGDYGDKIITGLQKKHANKIYEKQLATGKIRSAAEYVKVFSIIVESAKRHGIFNHPTIGIEMDNPFKGLRVKSNKSREEVWTEEETNKLLDEASEGVKTAIMLAYWTSQRQTDIINLKWSDYDGKYIVIKQSKTDAGVKIPVHKLRILKKYLDGLERRHDNMVCYFNIKTNQYENYKSDLFKKHFIKLKRLIGVDKQFKDFRRTSITKLAQAGCTIPEIASFSGHSHNSIQKMMDVYIARTSKISDNAGEKLNNA